MKQKLRTTIVFLTGVLVATCVFQFVYPPPKDAMAYSDCIQTGPIAKYTNGDINTDKEFTILYKVPSCYANNGYSMKTIFINDDILFGITYEKPDFNKTSTFGGSSGGGMKPVN